MIVGFRLRAKSPFPNSTRRAQPSNFTRTPSCVTWSTETRPWGVELQSRGGAEWDVLARIYNGQGAGDDLRGEGWISCTARPFREKVEAIYRNLTQAQHVGEFDMQQRG